MRLVLPIACLFSIVAATVVASPWSRLKSGGFVRPWRADAEDPKWADERQLGPYLLRSEFPLRDVQDLVHDLGDLQADLEQTLELQCEPREIQIHMFSTKRSYTNYLTMRVPDGVKRQALYVPGTDADRICVYRHGELDIDVRHETTHALLHTALPYVPIWIDEGFAEYFEVVPSLRLKGHSHKKELQTAIRFQRWRPKIEELEGKSRFLDMGRDDYRDSWGIVHFLLNGPKEARESLKTYFEEIQSGDVPTPLSKQLRRKIPNLDQAIADHLMRY